MRWSGRVTDGLTAASREAVVTPTADGLKLEIAGSDAAPAVWLYRSLRASLPIVPDAHEVLIETRAMPGATLFVAAPGFAAHLKQAAPHLSLRASRTGGYKLGGIVGGVAFSIAAAVFVLDLSPSKGIARMMPDTARAKLGDSVLKTLPVQKTCDGTEGRAALDALAKRLLPNEVNPGARIAVLDWSLLNALAVPGGRVVLTREIIAKAANADEIAAVLAHEFGHGAEFHPEAGLVRTVGFWALVQMVFTGTPGAVGNVGSSIVQLAYSRTSEREADQYALKLLREARISAKPFAGFFRRLEGGRSKPSDGKQNRGLFPRDVFESHPAPPERIAIIEAVPDYPSTPALTEAQWSALRRICGAAVATPSPTVNAGTTTSPLPQPAPSSEATINDEQLRTLNIRIAGEPNNAMALYQRAELHRRASRYRDAIADYDRAIAIEKTSATYWFGRASARHALREYDQAVADYTEAVRHNPRHAPALAGRGTVQRVQRRNDEALADLNASLAINGRYVYAYYNRGLLNKDTGKFNDAIQDFSKVVELEPSHASGFARRGETYERLNQRPAAIADYRAALKASPSSPGASTAFEIARGRLKALGAE